MKDGPPSSPRERTPFEKFQDLTKKVITVPKSEIDKREAEWKQGRAVAGKRARTEKPK